MADKKISALTASTTPLAGTEVLPIVQAGATVKVSVANLTAGRAMAALSGSFGSSGTGANLNTKPNTYTFGTAIVPSFVMESNASGGTATLASSQGAIVWGTAASPTASINLVQANPSASSRNYLSFSSTASGTYQETLRLAEFGDVNVPIGNVVIGTSGKGIDFSATAGTGTSELLADYEEGTWTPQYTNSTPPTTPYTMVVQSATYVKVGRQVTVRGIFKTSNVNTAGAAGGLQITGLPYTAASSSNGYSVCNITFATNWGVNYPLNGLVNDGTSYIALQYRLTSNGTDNEMLASDLAAGAAANKNWVIICATYFV